MRFVPIPTPRTGQAVEDTELWKTRAHWMPFMPRIAARSDETLGELIDHVRSGRVQLGVVFDTETQTTHAVIGMVYRILGREHVGEVHWVTGWGAKDWQHLLPQLEKYLKEHKGCTKIKPICRPGWQPLLKVHGYKRTHVMMEKRL